jgi:hypothetical protein
MHVERNGSGQFKIQRNLSGGTEENHVILSENGWCRGRYSNWLPPEYSLGVIESIYWILSCVLSSLLSLVSCDNETRSIRLNSELIC